MTISDVEKWLEQVGDLNALVEGKMAEREKILALAAKCTASLDGIPRGTGISDKVGTGGVALVTLAEETDRLIDLCIAKKEEIVGILELLPRDEYMVLHRQYVLLKKVEDIAKECFCSERTVYRYRRRGLLHLAEILSKKEDSPS